MAAEPTVAFGSRPTRSSISRNSSTRSRHASQRRRWSRAHSRSLPSRRSSSTALGEILVQRSELDVVIDLRKLGPASVERVNQFPWGRIDDLANLVVGELREVAQQAHDARLERS